MSDDKVTMTEVESSRLDYVEQHLATYLSSGGRDGHVQDLRVIGGLRFTTTLLLETVGRKSGERRISPLIYGDTGGEVVVIASKGGADVHPGWFFNLTEMNGTKIQIGGQAFDVTWREAKGAERERIWAFMAELYPPYHDYKAATSREIPVVCFTIGNDAEPFKA